VDYRKESNFGAPSILSQSFLKKNGENFKVFQEIRENWFLVAPKLVPFGMFTAKL
jgi:hypothetical protein